MKMVDDPRDPLIEGDDDLEDDLEGIGEGEEGETGEGDGEPQPQPVEPQEPLPAEQPVMSKAQRRIRGLIERNKAMEAENAQYRQHLLDLQKQSLGQSPQQPQQQQGMTQQEELAYLSQLDEAQRLQYFLQRGQQETQATTRRLELQMAVQKDASDYSAFVAADPEFRRAYSAQVETLFNESLRRGQPIDRVRIHHFLVGEKVAKDREAALQKAKRQGATRIAAQRTRPGSGRSTVGAEPGSGRSKSAEDTLRERLEGGAYNR